MRNLFSSRENLCFLFFLIFVAFTPVSKAVANISEGMCIAVWLFTGRPSEKIRRLKKNKSVLLLSSLFLFYAAGMFWTSDIREGLHELSIRHYLVTIPLIAGSLPFNRKKIHLSMVSFLPGNFIACLLVHYIIIANHPLLDGTPEIPSPFIHRIRFSLFLCISVFLTLYLLETYYHKLSRYYFLGYILLFLFFLETLLILGGRSGQAAFFLSLPFYLIFRFRILLRHKALAFFIFLFFLVILPLACYFLIPPFRSRIELGIREAREYLTDRENTYLVHSSVGKRFYFWENSVSVIKEYFWTGTGTGDLKRILLPRLAGNRYGIKPDKPHNQFLEIWAMLGIFALFYFLFHWGLIIMYSSRTFFPLLLIFNLIMFVSFMTDSTLEGQSGASIWAIFNSLLTIQPED